ncbi:hypothetical protein [Saccharothrix xinjiangensis]|uniref:MFS transporter n=1 Tax=Saccharothrix xinjiangensis TaxID=204798 RepID=A0ABV9YA69_9PSEU
MPTNSLVFTQLRQMPATAGYGFGESMLVTGLLLAAGTTTVSGRAVPGPAASTTVLPAGAAAALLALVVAASTPGRPRVARGRGTTREAAGRAPEV